MFAWTREALALRNRRIGLPTLLLVLLLGLSTIQGMPGHADGTGTGDLMAQVPSINEHDLKSGNINQRNNSCGVAAATMILDYYLPQTDPSVHAAISLDAVAKTSDKGPGYVRVENDGTNTIQLSDGLEQAGPALDGVALTATPRTTDQDHWFPVLKAELDAKLPVIVFLADGGRINAGKFHYGHFIVVSGYTADNSIIYHEPYDGTIHDGTAQPTIPNAEFGKDWGATLQTKAGVNPPLTYVEVLPPAVSSPLAPSATVAPTAAPTTPPTAVPTTPPTATAVPTAPPAPRFRVIIRTSSTINSDNSVAVSCSAGEQLLNGGYDDAGYPDGIVYSSYPSSSTTWTLNLTYGYGASPGIHDVTAYAMCLQSSVSIGQQIVTTDSANGHDALATCPSSSSIIGGGFKATLGGIGSDWSYGVNNGWSVTFIPSLGTSPGDVRAYAICASSAIHVTASPIASTPNPDTAHASASASVGCPSGTALIGGGYGQMNTHGIYPVDKPTGDGMQWTVTADYGDPVVAHALCATFGS